MPTLHREIMGRRLFLQRSHIGVDPDRPRTLEFNRGRSNSFIAFGSIKSGFLHVLYIYIHLTRPRSTRKFDPFNTLCKSCCTLHSFAMPVAVQDLIQPPMGQTTSHYAVKETPELRSNGGKSIDPSDLGWLRETSKDTDCAEMQRRYKEDGYILIKHLIPREDIFDMREQ
jgi:hypothetical protein